MRTARLLGLLSMLIWFASENVRGQLVFIPDTNLRNWMNSYAVGCVDANGWFNPNDPGILEDTTFSISPDNTWDMTGFDALPNCRRLSMGCIEGGNCITAITAFPDSLRSLWIEYHGGLSTISGLPATLRAIALFSCSLDSLGPLPDGLRSLSLENVVGLEQLPSVPASVSTLWLINLPDLLQLPILPTGALSLNVTNCPLLDQLPDVPQNVRDLRLISLPNIGEWPVLPDSLRFLQMLHMPGLGGALPDLPDHVVDITLHDLPGLTSFSSVPPGLVSLDINDCSSLSVIPDPLPPQLSMLGLAFCPLVTCLPWLHDSMYVYVEFSGVDCIPNHPMNDFQVNPAWLGTRPCSVFGPDCVPPVITGKVFNDVNGNGVEDDGEPPVSATAIRVEPEIGLVWTDTAGRFRVSAPPGTFNITPESGVYVTSFSPPQHNALLQTPADRDSLNDFGFSMQSGAQDLRVHVVHDVAWAGFGGTVWLTVRNIGTTTMDASVSLILDTVSTFVGSEPAPDGVSGQTFTWALPALPPGSWTTIPVQVNTAVVPIGTPVHHEAMVGPLSGDLVPEDNQMHIDDVVVAAYDPNEKHVTPAELTQEELLDGGFVNYTIHFQNTGNFMAARVVVTDTLVSDLDISSMEVLGFSHPMTWHLADRTMIFSFDDIMLPDSSADEPGSHGFVSFRIRPMSTLGPGALVLNRANIYFDFNDPVITAPCVLSIAMPQTIEEQGCASATLFPNPATDHLIIALSSHASNVRYSVINATGAVVKGGALSNRMEQISIADLPSGAYAIHFNSLPERAVVHFIKQ
ncbi:MAG: T9SS type A sorting domain-containing protein [Flavobacteriales bacterium]